MCGLIDDMMKMNDPSARAESSIECHVIADDKVKRGVAWYGTRY